MKLSIPFAYTTLYVFQLILRFGDKRSIKIKDLFNSRDELLKNVLYNYYNERKKLYEIENDWDSEIEFEEIFKEEELNKMLDDYPDIFYKKNEDIYIFDDIEFNEIMLLLKEFDIPTERFHDASDSEKFHKSIGITKIYEDRKKYKEFGYNLEKEIEAAYMNNASPAKLKLLLYKRFVFLLNVGLNNKQYVLEFFDLPDDEDKEISIDEEYDYYLNSEYVKNNEEYPIDKDLYENSELYEDILEYLNPIQCIIEEPYQYAIFGKGPLFDSRYFESFTKLSMSEIFSETEKSNEEFIDLPSFDEIDIDDEKRYATFSFDIEEEEFAFYIVYIKKLNDLIEHGRKDLIDVRNRILYMIDDIKYCLFDQKNLNKYYEEAINYELEENSFDYFSSVAKYFIEDVFEGRAGKTIEKLLFTSTYYEITNDEEIEEILEKYKDDYRYETYSQIILGKSKGYSKIKK